ncbi:gap junction protein alpha 9a [Melanotaenia boesemani]|uniref:gap junction protein alpha 9a n=1 Tax=Melanotaenia boesemani TaxID=1250792 RepID=UPI001C055558|nr:gap junction protein alpha 9a [Melanotaenia boesemani]
MGDWNFLGGILEEVHIHSTMVGKIWLTILFIFRMLVLGVAAEDVWNDEQVDFICNTDQPGCRNVCYDLAFPISLIRYWVLQVIFVSSPSLVYMGHALYRLRALEKARQKKKALLWRELELVDVELAVARKRIEREMKQLDHGKLNKAPLRGSLLRTYVAHIIIRSVVEVTFMAGQYLLYGFHLYPLFKCERDPCPNAVDCYVSRPTEKSVFMVFMQSIAALSLFLSILEILHLGYKKIKKTILDFYALTRDEREEPDYFNANKSKNESAVQTCTSASRKATIASAPSDYNLLMGGQGPNMYPNLMKSLTFLPLQGQQDVDDSKCSAQRPPECNNILTTIMPCSSCCDSPTKSKQKSESFFHLPHHSEEDDSSQRESPEPPKCPQKAAHASSSPTLPVSISKRPWGAHGSFQCSTVPESRSSDTDSYGGTKSSSIPPCSEMPSKPISQHQGRPSTPESLDDSSLGSRHNSRPPSSNCKASMASTASSRRAPDLKI